MNNRYFPNTVYDNLPSSISNLFEGLDYRERDVLLLSCLTSLSSCFPKISFKTKRGKPYFLNMNCFIIAPAASNKSISIFGRKIVEKFEILDKTLRNIRSLGNESNRTPLKWLIPGNNSYAGIIDCIRNNKGVGLIHESEADIIGDNLSKDWGNYSTLLRQAFEHERISVYRKQENQIKVINTPKVSTFLTGTPDQVSKIIPNSHNGL